MFGENKTDKIDTIRRMLLKTVGKNPDLFCYYASLLEARELLNSSTKNNSCLNPVDKPSKLITEI